MPKLFPFNRYDGGAVPVLAEDAGLANVRVPVVDPIGAMTRSNCQAERVVVCGDVVLVSWNRTPEDVAPGLTVSGDAGGAVDVRVMLSARAPDKTAVAAAKDRRKAFISFSQSG
jgi:hypothetical protein